MALQLEQMVIKPQFFFIMQGQKSLIELNICNCMRISIFIIKVCINCIAVFFCAKNQWIILLEINFCLFYSLFVLCFENNIFSIDILIRSFWLNIQTLTPFDNNHYICNNLPNILTNIYQFGQKSFNTYMPINIMP